MKDPVYSLMKSFYKKNKEIILYLFFGGVSFLLNFVLFIVIKKITPINELVNNVICWIVCVLFQFITNRLWVFDGKIEGTHNFIIQVITFAGGRVLTLLLEEILLLIFITFLGYNVIIVKLIAQAVVIILNYIISKFWVFKK